MHELVLTVFLVTGQVVVFVADKPFPTRAHCNMAGFALVEVIRPVTNSAIYRLECRPRQEA